MIYAPNPACIRLAGFVPLKEVDSMPKRFLYNEHCPRLSAQAGPPTGR